MTTDLSVTRVITIKKGAYYVVVNYSKMFGYGLSFCGAMYDTVEVIGHDLDLAVREAFRWLNLNEDGPDC